MDQEFRGLRAVISGGVGDIGRAVAAELLRRGAAVTLVDVVDVAVAQTRIRGLSDLGQVDYAASDVSDRAAIDRVFDALDRVDVVHANAGIVEASPFLDVSVEHWRRHLDINLTGAFHLAQAGARRMVADGTAGRIAFTGSWVGAIPWPEIAPYSVSKAGIEMLARSMARELAPHGILVNVVAPGIVDAGLAGHQLRTDPAYAERAKAVTPLGFQSPDQIARAVAFLCSPATDYMTGSTLLADGGCSLFQFDR